MLRRLARALKAGGADDPVQKTPGSDDYQTDVEEIFDVGAPIQTESTTDTPIEAGSDVGAPVQTESNTNALIDTDSDDDL